MRLRMLPQMVVELELTWLVRRSLLASSTVVVRAES